MPDDADLDLRPVLGAVPRAELASEELDVKPKAPPLATVAIVDEMVFLVVAYEARITHAEVIRGFSLRQ